MNQYHHQQRGRDEPPSTGYQDFFNTQPPLFHKTEEPLDADAWLCTIESKFALLSAPCSEANTELFAAQQLHGTARIWWDHYYAMRPDGHIITWEEFRTTFRAHHIPEGLIERKLNEFLALTQGTRTVMQYAQAFNHLCQYAGYHADTDTKKRDRFCRGLNTKLKERLNLVRVDTFNELVNMAITQEDCISAHRAEKKRKIPTGLLNVQPPRYRLVQNTVTRAPPQNNPSGTWIARPPQQSRFNRPPVPQPQQQLSSRLNLPQFNQGNNNNRCLNCGSSSHLIRNCPQPRKSFQG
jgi:hypothetical protein